MIAPENCPCRRCKVHRRRVLAVKVAVASLFAGVVIAMLYTAAGY